MDKILEEIEELPKKICVRCKLPKLINEFGIEKRNKDGHNRYCKVCLLEFSRKSQGYQNLKRSFADWVPRIEGDIAYIPLTKGAESIIDLEDLDKVIGFNWCLSTGYAAINTAKKRCLMHRCILNAPKNQQIDHINLNRLDNRKINLRLCNQSQNNANMFKLSTNKSGYRGVCWDKKHKKWRATIQINKKHTHIGYFDDINEAVKVRDAKAKELFGEFARLNYE